MSEEAASANIPDPSVAAPSVAGADPGAVVFPQAPVPLRPISAREARQRWAQISSDAGWQKRYFSGDLTAAQEKFELDTLMSGATISEALADGPVEGETVYGNGVRRRDLISAAADLRDLWSGDTDNVETVLAELLDPNAQIDPRLLQEARRYKASALKDDAFRAGIREGDPEVMKRLVLWDFIIGVATVTP
jgi:hypothetical protein